MRRAAKVDGNHRTIVAAFKTLGCTVQSLAAVGKGVPDLLVAFAGLNHLVEIKDGRKAKSARKQRPAQVVWASTWRAPRHLVESVEDVRRLVAEWCKMHHTPVHLRPVPSDVEVDASDYEHHPEPSMSRVFEQDFDASDYERPQRVVVHGGLTPRREVRVTPNVIRAKGGV